MKSCSFTKTTYSPDPIGMAFNEGRRSVVLDILQVLKKDESAIMDFFKQLSEKEREYDL